MTAIPLTTLFVALSLGAATTDKSSPATAEVPLLEWGRVPLTLFGERAYFVVDTGADITYLDLKYKERLGAPIDRGTEVSAFSHNAETVAYACPELVIGERRFQPKLAGCQNMAMARMVVGEPCDGILGMNVLGDHVISFDPDKNLFSIEDGVSARVKGQALPLPLLMTSDRNGFVVQAVLNGTGLVHFRLDSGANDFLFLSTEDWQKAFPNGETNWLEIPSIGAGGQVGRKRIARIKTLVIGTNLYTNIIAGLTTNPGVRSSLGYGFLKQHVATIDFPNRQLYLVPGGQFGLQQEADMSGLHLLRAEGKTIVHSVDQGSPAFVAGLRAEDQIISLNSEQVSSLSLQRIREVLRQRDGDEVTMEASQQGKITALKFRLKKFI